jgi:hypothetical protein
MEANNGSFASAFLAKETVHQTEYKGEMRPDTQASFMIIIIFIIALQPFTR